MQLAKEKCATAMGRILASLLVPFYVAGLAFGQAETAVRFNVPYAFKIGSKALPAGFYTFLMSPGASMLLVRSQADVSASMHIITRIEGPNELFRGGCLIFDKAESGPILADVWLSDTDGALLHVIPKGHAKLNLWGTPLDTNRRSSGRETYDLTCANCHGERGKGNRSADKFFHLTVPRLNSTQVQSMSDAALKQQITQGSAVMPPVEIDESGFRHRLPPQDVDKVIAYVRTLKQQ